MTKDEALRLALEALEKISMGGDPRWADETIIAIKEALETKDEPVAVVDSTISGHIDWLCPIFPKQGTPLYTHPKKWVWLTDKEVDECLQGLPTQTIDVYARRIETKIKDKNT